MEEEKTRCTYCGAIAECRDHVIPVFWLSFGRSYDKSLSWTVPSCNTCNNLAGSYTAFSIPEKALYILKRFSEKNKKILNGPQWLENELNSLDYTLRESVWGKLVLQRVLLERQKHLVSISALPDDWQRPTFVENQIKDAIKTLNIRKKTRRRKNKSPLGGKTCAVISFPITKPRKTQF